MNKGSIDSLLCAALRGEMPAWPDTHDVGLVDAVVERSSYHGVQGLLYVRLQAVAGWPTTLIQTLRQQVIRGTALELLRRQVVADVLATLAGAGVEPLLFKGTALAYSLYDDPAWRPRCDTDLIVPADQRERAMEVLATLGYVRVLELGELASYQACMTRDGAGAHTLDLHWKINNSELFSRLFGYQELRAAAEPLPALAPQALGANPVHALLIACMHRAAHVQAPYVVDGVVHYGGDRLIWLYDIHLLATSFLQPQWGELLDLARRKGFRSVCLEGIEQTRLHLGTLVPPEVLEELGREGPVEPTAAYLKAGHLRRRWLDLWAYKGVREKLRFARELAFPPAAYMRERFPRARLDWLPWLYVRRAIGGMRRRRGDP